MYYQNIASPYQNVHESYKTAKYNMQTMANLVSTLFICYVLSITWKIIFNIHALPGKFHKHVKAFRFNHLWLKKNIYILELDFLVVF